MDSSNLTVFEHLEEREWGDVDLLRWIESRRVWWRVTQGATGTSEHSLQSLHTWHVLAFFQFLKTFSSIWFFFLFSFFFSGERQAMKFFLCWVRFFCSKTSQECLHCEKWVWLEDRWAAFRIRITLGLAWIWLDS